MFRERLDPVLVPAARGAFYDALVRRGGYHRSQYRHDHQRRRAVRIFDLLSRLQLGEGLGTCLELGCCEGHMTAQLAMLFHRVVAVDVSAEAIARAPVLPGVEYLHRDVECWDADEPFDLVLMVELLEHLDDPARLVARMARRARWILATSPVNEQPNERAFDPALLWHEAFHGDASGHIWSWDQAGFLSLFEGLTVTHSETVDVTAIVIARGGVS